MLPKLPIIHFLLIITLINFYSLQLAAAQCHPDDEAGLLAFKSGIISDPSGILRSWIPGTDCCSFTWVGITCSSTSSGTNRVTNLELNTLDIFQVPNISTQILSGTISPSLSKLQYLQTISLSNLRNLSGPFPTFLFKLPRLQVVNIENSKLSGKLPKNIGSRLPSQLDTFSVDGNRFSGTIPSSLGLITQLRVLSLSRNMFTGNIPQTISNLANLTLLHLDGNQLTGTIPDFFKGKTILLFFNASDNKLTGNIPGSIITSTELRYLEVSHNALSGQIPEFLGRLNLLFRLDLSWNQFQGTVPKSFANLTGISELDLSHNSLISPFPEMNETFIRLLDLSYNQFHLGQIPAWVTSSPSTYYLKLAKCGIKIKLDDWKPVQTTEYDYIDLSENEITGSPVQLLNQTNGLLEFYASGNKLKFNLESLKFAPTLRNLDLSRNLVFGKVPKAVSGLVKLNVSHNHLCGELPKTKFPASAFAGNDCLCGSPLPQCKG